MKPWYNVSKRSLRVASLFFMLFLSRIALADPGAISICEETPSNLFVGRVDLNGVGVSSGVRAGVETKPTTVAEFFSELLNLKPRGALAVNANFYITSDKSTWPPETPIGQIMSFGKPILFSQKDEHKNKNPYPININKVSGASADTFVIYGKKTDTHAAIVDFDKWPVWKEQKSSEIESAVSGLIIFNNGKTNYTKAKIAKIDFGKSRQRTAIGFSSSRDNVIYVMAIKKKLKEGAKIQDLPELFKKIPEYCGDTKNVVDSIFNLDGGGSTQIQVLPTGSTQHEGLNQDRKLPAILYFEQD
jgi:exopolysaccharide biosynthesis protein